MIIVRLLAASALLISLLCAAVSAVIRAQPTAPQACAAPCWQSFQPGVTTYADAVALFNGMGWVAAASFCQSASSVCNTFAWAAPDQPGHRVGSVFTFGRLDAIVFQQPGIRLGDLLLTLGAPDRVDQFKSFDTTGARYSIYRVGWGSTELQIRIDCPTTYADLLFKAPTVISRTVQDTVVRDYSPNLLENMPPAPGGDFRVVCRPS